MLKTVDSICIDLLHQELRFALNSLYAVHCAMDSGGYDPDEFLDGLFGVANHFERLLDELQEAYDPDAGRE